MKSIYCETCKHEHGPLYICEHYPQILKDKLSEAGEAFRKSLHDPEWIKEQQARGIPAAVITAFQFFAGVKP